MVSATEGHTKLNPYITPRLFFSIRIRDPLLLIPRAGFLIGKEYIMIEIEIYTLNDNEDYWDEIYSERGDCSD